MKKKGFTLIELLAVIVILAIIALIVTPIVSDIIESSKKAAAKRSVEGYIEAANNAAAVSLIDTAGINVTNEKYSFETGEDNEALSKVDISGKKPSYVYLEYDYQLLRVVLANFCYNGYAFDYDNGIIEDGTIDYCSVAFTNRPKIVITGEGELNSKVTIAINYTETTVGKQYKIGNGEYIDYTEPFDLESSRELASQRDEHGNLKICAKATIESGESTEICRSINKLDLDYPETPTIDAAGGYPVITEYGVSSGLLTIEPAPSTEATPYVSFDGTNWTPYEVGMGASGSTIYAKVVKTKSGLESEVASITTTTPADAFNSNAYDGDRSTSDQFGYYANSAWVSKTGHDKYVYIDESMIGKKITMYVGFGQYSEASMYFINKDNETISSFVGGYGKNSDVTVTVPEGAVKIKFYHGGNSVNLYEIGPYNTPEITNTFVYPKLTEYGVEQGYNKISISYVPSQAQKLYKIGDGEWQNYTGTIDLPLGQTIYAKGINKFGTETEVSSYTSVLNDDSLNGNAYDGNRSTYDTTGYGAPKTSNRYIDVDSSMVGKKITMYIGYVQYYAATAFFINSNGEEIGTIEGEYGKTSDVEVTVPEGAVKIKFYNGNGTYSIYEIGPYNTPEITNTFVYPKLTQSGVQQGYNKISIYYVPSQVQKLYKIGDGEWQNYTGVINLPLGQTIYAKGVNKFGTETEVSSYTSVLNNDALSGNAYDGNRSTYDTAGYGAPKTSNRYIDVDSSMVGKKITMYIGYVQYHTATAFFVNSNNEEIGTIEGEYGKTSDVEVTVPTGAVKIKFYNGNGTYSIYEIGPAN